MLSRLQCVVTISCLFFFVSAQAQNSQAGGAKGATSTSGGALLVPITDPAAPAQKGESGVKRSAASRNAQLDEAALLEQRDISVLVVAGNETTLSSQMAGKIKKIYFGLGDAVPLGALLLEFDCVEQDAQMQTVEAEYRGARETHLTKLRLQALGAAGELEVTVAAASADKAKSQVTYRVAQSAFCKVHAPFSGRIAKTRVKIAESVPAGQSMFDIVDPGALKAQLFVPANWVYWLRAGVQFEVKISGDNKRYRASVSKLNSRVEGVSQFLELEGRFEGGGQGLLPGMVGTAIFPTRPKR